MEALADPDLLVDLLTELLTEELSSTTIVRISPILPAVRSAKMLFSVFAFESQRDSPATTVAEINTSPKLKAAFFIFRILN
jgi:hypothetical protein